MRSPDFAREPDSSSSLRLRRRDWIAGVGCVVATLGCRPERRDAASENPSTPTRTDVPLRVLWMGTQADADVLQRTWGSISEQPLDIHLIEPIRAPAAVDAPDDPTLSSSQEFIRKAATSDVLLYPVSMMGELVTAKRIMPLLLDTAPPVNSENKANEQESIFARSEEEDLPVSLRMATSFASEQMATPLGGDLPSLILSEGFSDTPISTWDQYTELVHATGGKCGEPTAAGWAGAMYLWRLARSIQSTWLFDRETLEPLLAQPTYVAVLQQMRDAVQKTSPEFQSLAPGEIYQRILKGQMRAGIGFPEASGATGDDSTTDAVMTFVSLPSSESAASSASAENAYRQSRPRSMVDPFMLVGSMAASCRQTAAADGFLGWLTGGQGSEPLYRSIASFVDVATPASPSSVDMAERYRAWLSDQLSGQAFVPTLQLAGAAEYYSVLDTQVRACVLGDASAETACETIRDQWRSLHRKHDQASQKRMWRRAQSVG